MPELLGCMMENHLSIFEVLNHNVAKKHNSFGKLPAITYSDLPKSALTSAHPFLPGNLRPDFPQDRRSAALRAPQLERRRRDLV